MSLLTETPQKDRDFAKEIVDLLSQACSISNTGGGAVKTYVNITMRDLSVPGNFGITLSDWTYE